MGVDTMSDEVPIVPSDETCTSVNVNVAVGGIGVAVFVRVGVNVNVGVGGTGVAVFVGVRVGGTGRPSRRPPISFSFLLARTGTPDRCGH